MLGWTRADRSSWFSASPTASPAPPGVLTAAINAVFDLSVRAQRPWSHPRHLSQPTFSALLVLSGLPFDVATSSLDAHSSPLPSLPGLPRSPPNWLPGFHSCLTITRSTFVRPSQARSRLPESFLSRHEVGPESWPWPVVPCTLAPEQAFGLFLQVFLEHTRRTLPQSLCTSRLSAWNVHSPGQRGAPPESPGQKPRSHAGSAIPWSRA